jgi:sulfur carrier protein ThiS
MKWDVRGKDWMLRARFFAAAVNGSILPKNVDQS